MAAKTTSNSGGRECASHFYQLLVCTSYYDRKRSYVYVHKMISRGKLNIVEKREYCYGVGRMFRQ